MNDCFFRRHRYTFSKVTIAIITGIIQNCSFSRGVYKFKSAIAGVCFISGFSSEFQIAQRNIFPDQMHSIPDLHSDLEKLPVHFSVFLNA